MAKTNFIHVGSEKDIEMHLIDNLDDISKNCFWGSVRTYHRQLRLEIFDSNPICDLMIWHHDGTGTVVEVKKYKSDLWQSYAIGQVLMYGEIIRAKLNEYPRMVICSDYISPLLKLTVKQNKLPIRLLELDGDKAFYI